MIQMRDSQTITCTPSRVTNPLFHPRTKLPIKSPHPKFYFLLQFFICLYRVKSNMEAVKETVTALPNKLFLSGSDVQTPVGEGGHTPSTTRPPLNGTSSSSVGTFA